VLIDADLDEEALSRVADRTLAAVADALDG
jgi:hypothetical protein